MQTYLDGLYQGDPALLGDAFHPAAMLFNGTDGDLVQLDLPAYLGIVRGRPSPASRGDVRQDEVVLCTIASDTTAHARVRNQYPPKSFTDDLTLVRLDDRWRIVSKVWHYTIDQYGSHRS
ncbi:nuclear transport factor 2 family protein [Qaidamihabitans albus]|uniref:nuclear transport factor 2 family protein n=1 Tax=Qaidamihabitans albus TaxID=2795733 RepID=UPI0018F25930|nr:nuclear transport factor 2 family protein [Qaidamihabitans albus]